MLKLITHLLVLLDVLTADRTRLALEVLMLRQQLAVMKRTTKRLRIWDEDRAFWAFMRMVFLGMSYLAWPIGFVVSHIILAAVYYLVLTPVGLVMRLVGYDPMKRRFDRDGSSYWIARDPSGVDSKRYFRQF